MVRKYLLYNMIEQTWKGQVSRAVVVTKDLIENSAFPVSAY